MSSQLELLLSENEKLKKTIQELGEARNKEILDLQDIFSKKLREASSKNGSEEIKSLNNGLNDMKSKITEIEKRNKELLEENDALKQQIKKLTLSEKSLIADKNYLNSKINELKESLSAQQQSAQTPQLKTLENDFDEMLKPFEEQIESLAILVQQKQNEIERLKCIIKEGCEERVRLQSRLGLT